MNPDSVKPKRGTQWHNPLPLWIVESVEYQKLRQGCRHTLQSIANRCDDPKRFKNTGTMLACIGGHSLIADCGCARATFWRHVSRFTQLGWLVCLSYGGGRLANVYGIPGHRGELEAFRAETGQRRGSGRGGIWTREDSDEIRRVLVSKNKTLESASLLVSENRTAPVSKQDGRRPKTGRHPSKNKTLPSPFSPPYHPNTTSGAGDESVQGGKTFTGGQADSRALLEQYGIHEPLLSELANDPAVTVPRIQREWEEAKSKNSPTGYLVSKLRTPGKSTDPGVGDQTIEWSKAINDGLVTVLPSGVGVDGCKAKYNAEGLILDNPDGTQLKVALAEASMITRWVIAQKISSGAQT